MASVMNLAVKKEVLDDQDREKHEKLRNFSFSLPNKRLYAASGAMNETVLEALERSGKFKSHVKKNQGKDILIVRKEPHHADLAPHFPCCLIEEGEELAVRLSLRKTSVLKPDKRGTIPEQLVTFYVSRAGGPNLGRKHLKNMGNQDIPYLCIYAYRGETVKEALERDGRFEEIVFEEGSELPCIEGSLTVEMCYKVNKSLDGKRYRLKKEKTFSAGTLESGSRPADQPAGPSDSGSRPADQPAGPSREQAKSAPGSEKSAKAKPSVGKKNPTPGRKLMRANLSPDYHPIPGSDGLLQELRGKLDSLVEHMKERKEVRGRKEVLELLTEEFGRNTDPFWDGCNEMDTIREEKERLKETWRQSVEKAERGRVDLGTSSALRTRETATAFKSAFGGRCAAIEPETV
ncbi:hypothetical protein GJAV_G00001210 [Gymnothorax javanicus]|nr:hypothetical protein GJAV_G00001210 [Gymnothorax javanicus]